MSMKPKFALIGLCVVLCAAATQAQDTSYPVRRLQYIMPTPAGGPNDFLARLFAERLAKTMGQPVIVENRPGASWTIATEYVARQTADGYTLLHVAATHILNPNFFPKLPYDPIRDFEPVTQSVSTIFMLTVHAGLGVNNVAEFIARARANPGKLTYGRVGVGSSHQLGAELMSSMAGIKMLHVPYKGGPQITQALLSREIDATFISLFPVRKLVSAGELRGLGVTTTRRSPLLPAVPPIAESAGMAGYEMDVWQGTVVRAGTPRAIINRLNRELVAVLKSPLDAARLTELGLDPVGSTPEHFLEVMKSDMVRWAKVIKDAGIKPVE